MLDHPYNFRPRQPERVVWDDARIADWRPAPVAVAEPETDRERVRGWPLGAAILDAIEPAADAATILAILVLLPLCVALWMGWL